MLKIDEKFDIVIPVGLNEVSIINDVVNHIKKNIKGYNKIYLISSIKELYVSNCTTIDENIFPFNKKDIENIIGNSCRISWIYQQLLKLYSTKTLSECLDNVLIIDADVYVLKEIKFIDQNKPIFTVGYEYTNEYHIHSAKLHPNITRIYKQYSGVSHHMMFNRNYIAELFQLIENYHNKDFFNVFLNSLNISNLNDIKCSEYEIYFNFMCFYHGDKILIRELCWDNVKYLTDNMEESYHYVSVPKWFGTR